MLCSGGRVANNKLLFSTTYAPNHTWSGDGEEKEEGGLLLVASLNTATRRQVAVAVQGRLQMRYAAPTSWQASRQRVTHAILRNTSSLQTIVRNAGNAGNQRQKKTDHPITSCSCHPSLSLLFLNKNVPSTTSVRRNPQGAQHRSTMYPLHEIVLPPYYFVKRVRAERTKTHQYESCFERVTHASSCWGRRSRRSNRLCRSPVYFVACAVEQIHESTVTSWKRRAHARYTGFKYVCLV